MPTRAGLLTPRGQVVPNLDLAERRRLIRGQRVPLRAPRLRARRRLRVVSILRAIGACLGLGAVGILTWQAGRFFVTDARFAVADVRVAGTERLSPELIRAAAAVEGRNLCTLDLARARALVEAVPAIERAALTRHWPNRISIVVKEREPFALVNAGRLYWVDGEGVVLGAQPRAVAPPGPVLSGVEPERMTEGGAGLSSDRLAQGLAFLRELHRSHAALGAVLSEVDVSHASGPVLYTLDGTEVRLGNEAWEERLQRLAALLENLTATGESVASIDLRFQDLIVLRPRGGLNRKVER